jgi:hypothetical protein
MTKSNHLYMGSNIKISDDRLKSLLSNPNFKEASFKSYVDRLDQPMKNHGLLFVAHTLDITTKTATSTEGSLQDLEVPAGLQTLVTKHLRAIKENLADVGIRQEIIKLFLRPELFGGQDKWNMLTPNQRIQIVRGGLTVVGPAILGSIKGQGTSLTYWRNVWPKDSKDSAQKLATDDRDIPSAPAPRPKGSKEDLNRTKTSRKPIIGPSKSEQTTQKTTAVVDKLSPNDLLLKLASLEWLSRTLLVALEPLKVETALDIANLDPVKLVSKLQQDKESAAPGTKPAKDESKGSEFDYLLASVRLLDEKSGNALALLITPLSHSAYTQVLSKATVESLSKINITTAQIDRGRITQSESGKKIPVNNGLRLLQLLMNPEQAGISELARVIPPKELDKLNQLFATVGIPDASSLSVKSDVASEMEFEPEVWPQPAIRETGIAGDFWNEFFSIELICSSLEQEDNQGRLGKIKAALRENPCPSYQDKYPREDYSYLYNEQTEATIASLNKLVSQLNQGIDDDTITLAGIKEIYDAAAKLVYGKNTKIKWPADWQ